MESKLLHQDREPFDTYNRCFLVNADNVGSKQMQDIRAFMRGKAEVLMGKNTMMRKAIRGILDRHPDLEKILPCIVGNIGFVFTNEDLVEVRDMILEKKVKAKASAGAIAPLDVKVPAQNTGLGPEKTSFFQALQIPTKIARGTIEIINDVALIATGDKVGASEAALLNMLGISPFSYGLVISHVYDNGSVFSPKVLDITDDDIKEKFMAGIANIAAVSLAIGYPTAASAPHSIVNGFKNLLAIAAETEVTFAEAEKMNAYLADPSAFAVAAAPAAAAAGGGAAEEAAPAAKEESEGEDSDDMGFGLFD